MELLFLALLVLLMIAALISGFPVAFALPGSAILSIGLAALCGWLFVDNPDAFFAHGGPVEWLSAGVTNFRSLYWDVERDTLIAIPLFIFMGIMLQRSKVAEDLLIAMARLFGPVPGGLGISVIVVGALLAATTGIVGATVVAMGLISLPAMMRNNYSHSLACGTICASGTLGQIIPPSIVLIILSDQLASAAAQANAIRKTEFREATGEFSMPSLFDVSSASAGDMFMGALIPGLLLVSLYIAYVFLIARFKPEMAPPVRSEGKVDRQFIMQLLLALVPPLGLIFIVLGSIILGVATVNQAGAIGAVGALIMGGYRLVKPSRLRFVPALLALGAILVLAVLSQSFDLNFKSSTEGRTLALALALLAVAVLMVALCWSIWRVLRADKALHEVMLDTAKTTSMVFVILIGAAMLTSAFRGFGGEELVKEFLNGLPGGFWTQFIVVMLVIFLLGFFLDFIEIAVVVVPIVAPILLANPEANVTAVWLGVMIGLNIQTSFLTPPFGFALFYLRGVADSVISTLQIYRGAVVFIGLQLLALTIVGFTPKMVNFLPNYSYLTSETAPPPMNPRIQLCLEEHVFATYGEEEAAILAVINRVRALPLDLLPSNDQKKLTAAFDKAESVFAQVEKIKEAEQARLEQVPGYTPYHQQVREIRAEQRDLDEQIKVVGQNLSFNRGGVEVDAILVASLEDDLAKLKAQKAALTDSMPADWDKVHKAYKQLENAEKRARISYRRSADEAYQQVQEVVDVLASGDALAALAPALESLSKDAQSLSTDVLSEQIQQLEKEVGQHPGAQGIKSQLYKARRELRKTPDMQAVQGYLQHARALLEKEVDWRVTANQSLSEPLQGYLVSIKDTIGARQQQRLSEAQAGYIASCLSEHRNISLNF